MSNAAVIMIGDCREVLKTLPDNSMHCVVTSPPYWNLRDYKVKGQIGLEATIEGYITTMVEVFREVKRVMRDDGTLWLNLGSSYASGDTCSTRPHRPESDPACGTDDKAPQDSTGSDCVCSDLCDGCQAALSKGSDYIYQPSARSSQQPSMIVRGSEHLDSSKAPPDDVAHGVPVSTISESSPPRQEGCRHCANCGVCLSVLRSSSRDGRLCARKVQCIADTSSRELDFHTPDKDAWGWAYRYLSTPCLKFKPKDMIPVPWMIAMALQADGWWIRSEITWCKKAPMPESVQDRPTSATEKIFLLTKSESYYYDADAIRTPPSEAMLQQVKEGYNGQQTKMFEDNKVQNASSVKSRIIENARKRIDKQRGHSRRHAGFNDRWDDLTKAEQMACGSNMRNYWLLGPEPCAENHFATFPTEIPRRCILAGCPVGGVVLDPFGGSGTTGMVATELGRKSILIELNPEYVKLCEQRCNVTAGLPL